MYPVLAFLAISGLFFFSAVPASADVCAPPETGHYTITSSCTFANASSGNAVDGVYNGDLIIPTDVTLTVNAGQTVCWYPGNSILLEGGNIAINATGQLKECNLVQEMLANIGFDTHAAGQPARVYSNNLFVCTDEPCTATAPSAAGNLIVEGVIKMVGGTPAAGKVLTSDANGVASWQDAAGGGGGWTQDTGVVRLTTGTDNVGIGTTTPGAKLDVQGSTFIRGDSTNATFTSPGQLAIKRSNNAPFISFHTDAGARLGFFQIGDAHIRLRAETNVPVYIGGNSTDSLTILGSGNVGIGTTAPAQRLEINGHFVVQNANIFQAKNSGGTTETFLWPRWSDNVMYLNYGSAGFNIRNNSSASVMFIQNGGNVGIGTTAPGYKLTVSDTIHSSKGLVSAVDSRTNAKLLLYDLGASNWAGIGVSNVGTIQYRTGTSGDNFFSMTPDGKMGVGIVNPTGQLSVSNTTINQAPADAMGVMRAAMTGGFGIHTNLSTNSSDGTAFYFLALRTSESTAPNNKFLFRNDGHAFADQAWNGGGADVAEMYHIIGQGEPGDLVSLVSPKQSTEPGKTLKVSEGHQYDAQVLGIISTAPGLVAGYGDADTSMELTIKKQTDPRKPVALAGRVPVKVNLENGPIKAGDFLTSSSTPGVAMKATKTGRIVGQAMEDYDGSVQISKGVAITEQDRLNAASDLDPIARPTRDIGKIMIFVDTSWYTPNTSELEQRLEALEEKMKTLGS